MTERNFWRRIGITLALTLGFAPIGDALAQSPPRGTPTLAPTPRAPRLDATGACSDSEWIGLVRGDSCNLRIPGWRVEQLFTFGVGSDPKTFCRISWSRLPNSSPEQRSTQGGGPTPSGIDLLTTMGSTLRGLVRRCGVVGPLQATAAPPTPRQALPTDFPSKLESPDPLTLASRETLEREFMFQVGKTTLPFAAGETPRVRITFLDTHATWPPSDDRGTNSNAPRGGVPSGASGHGYALAHLARELVCDSSCGTTTCAAKISTRLALPLRRNPTANGEPFTAVQEGGFFGSPSDLAVAIRQEVAEWTRLKRRCGDCEPPHLILNLSLGWDHEILTRPNVDGGLGMVGVDGLNAEEMAVQAALEEAAVAGVLVIAASGNGSGPKLGKLTGGGALWPAAWSIGAPPTRPKTGPNTWAPTNLVPISGKPLVWAIGGIDRRGSLLANVRTKSTPTLVAYGDHAVARDLDGKYTDVLTGTSVSAAVASSIAALVWHTRPSLSAEAVMRLVHQSAAAMNRKAEHFRSQQELADDLINPEEFSALRIYPPTQPPIVRYLSLASALSLAWSQRSITEQVKPLALASFMDCTNYSEATACGSTIRVCGGTLGLNDGCPNTRFPTDHQTPWMLPQPGENQCPTCSIGGGPPPTSYMKQGLDLAARAETSTTPPLGLKENQGRQLRIAIPKKWSGGCLTDLRLDLAIFGGGSWAQAYAFPGRTLCAGDTVTVVLPIPKNITLGKATLAFKFADRPLSGMIPLYLIDQLPEEN